MNWGKQIWRDFSLVFFLLSKINFDNVAIFRFAEANRFLLPALSLLLYSFFIVFRAQTFYALIVAFCATSLLSVEICNVADSIRFDSRLFSCMAFISSASEANENRQQDKQNWLKWEHDFVFIPFPPIEKTVFFFVFFLCCRPIVCNWIVSRKNCVERTWKRNKIFCRSENRLAQYFQNRTICRRNASEKRVPNNVIDIVCLVLHEMNENKTKKNFSFLLFSFLFCFLLLNERITLGTQTKLHTKRHSHLPFTLRNSSTRAHTSSSTVKIVFVIVCNVRLFGWCAVTTMTTLKMKRRKMLCIHVWKSCQCKKYEKLMKVHFFFLLFNSRKE